ncbi:hypothetical protein HPB47_017604 [Ixodes persulcatus]|uniref:Uncharacterized protein n=1 Tax=Ixodes persulcatus TaxID=34615 RepID=A0AC60QMW1_IXOPE|nr:hypothetical protein HPB47_017604 [Ixodes persulcatus]
MPRGVQSEVLGSALLAGSLRSSAEALPESPSDVAISVSSVDSPVASRGIRRITPRQTFTASLAAIMDDIGESKRCLVEREDVFNCDHVIECSFAPEPTADSVRIVAGPGKDSFMSIRN